MEMEVGDEIIGLRLVVIWAGGEFSRRDRLLVYTGLVFFVLYAECDVFEFWELILVQEKISLTLLVPVTLKYNRLPGRVKSDLRF